MASRTRNSLNLSSRKAQFFIISAVTVVTLIFFISQWIQPSAILDTSAVALHEETFILSNVKEKTIVTVQTAKTCDDLIFNLDEFKNFVVQYAARKGMTLTFTYTISPCSQVPQATTINFNLGLKSFDSSIISSFSMKWP